MPTAATALWAIRFAGSAALSAAGGIRRPTAMRTLYEVLGLPPGAHEAQIKAAYRELARRLHPDVNPADAASAQRLAEINHAYEILGDSRARSGYDHGLAWQRTAMRRHYTLLAACTVVTFAVTLVAVSSVVRWHLQGAPLAEPPPVAPVADLPAALSTVGEAAADLGLPGTAEKEPGWTTFHDPRYDLTLRYPAGVFVFEPAQSDTNVHTFVSRDRRATFRIVAAENTRRVSLARFRSTLIRRRYAGASFERTPRRRHWFALAGTLGAEAFLERVTFSCDGKTMHGWQMRYPASQRATYDDLAELILRNHPHGNEPAAGCEEARPKRHPRR